MVLAALESPFLLVRATGKLKVKHFQQYLCKKLNLAPATEVDVLFNGDTLGPELQIRFMNLVPGRATFSTSIPGCVCSRWLALAGTMLAPLSPHSRVLLAFVALLHAETDVSLAYKT